MARAGEGRLSLVRSARRPTHALAGLGEYSPGGTPRFAATRTTWKPEDFAAAFSELLRFCARQRTAVMCAESVWWSCHRSLISDALRLPRHRGHPHRRREAHESAPYTSAASIIDGRLSYEAPDPQGRAAFARPRRDFQQGQVSNSSLDKPAPARASTVASIHQGASNDHLHSSGSRCSSGFEARRRY